MRVKHIISSVSIAIGLAVQVSAFGAGLGKMTVNSALGQPLNADIVILVPDANELKNLHANLASQASYQQAGLDMSAVLENIKFTIKSQPDGTALLHLSSSDPVQDPFLDIMVELEWGNGKIERDYTLLLDPPNMQHAMVSTPSVPPVANVPVTSTTSQQQQTVGAVSSSSRPTHRHAPVAQTGGEKAANTKTASAKTASAKTASAKTVKVHTGMTLSGIASQYKPEGVHLEQMLVGLYRDNPQAFEGNMNRMRSGQVLHIPDRATLVAIGEAAAAREVHLQAEDWHAYRQKLAGEVERSAAPVSQNHQAGGKIAPAVQDKSAAPVTSGGVLKLSKGSAPKQGQTGAAALSSAEKKQMAQDDAAAKQKAMEEEKTRLAMLEKNAQDMQRLLALKNQQLAAQKAAPAPVPTPAPAPATPTVVKPVLPHPVHKLVKPAPVPVSPQPAWYEKIDPLYVVAVGGVVVLLGLLSMVINSRKRRAGLSKFENSILTSVESKPNTVYNTQSGASVNTSNTSFLTDFSQSGLGTLDTHDVDPIAEAEVYMAYGRDVQAEEILKEAMQKEPQRHEIKVKLLEIYAGRNNLPAFEAIATDLYSALAGQESPLWDKAAEMGRKLDPRNPLYGGSSVTPVNEAPAEVNAPVIDEMLTLDEEPMVHPMDKVADLPDGSDESAPEPHDSPVSDEHDAGYDTGHDTGHDGDTDAGVWDVSTDNTLSGALDFDLGLSEEKKPVIDEMPNIADHEEFTLPAWAAPVEADTETAAVADDMTALDLEMPEGAHESMPEAHEALLADDTATSMDHATDHAELPTDELSMDMAPVTESLPEIAEEEPYQQLSHSAAEEEDLPEEMALEMPSDISLHDQPVMLDFSGIDLDLGEKQPQEEQLAAPATSVTQTEDMHVDTQVDTQVEQDGAKPSAPVELSAMEQEIKTKLELAQVYHEMGDSENAREILQEVLEEGDEAQRAEAQALMQTIANA